MTKEQAIKAMKEGHKVRHKYFTEEEWMRANGRFYYTFEDGCNCEVRQFWAIRNTPDWETGWEVVV